MNVKISFEDFQNVEMRVGLIKSVEGHPNADKLFVLRVDLGEDEERTIVAGLRGHYSKQDLEGRKAVFVANLKPVDLRGVESNGMILAAVNDNREEVNVLFVNEDVPVGERIS